MAFALPPSVLEAAARHARAVYPQESAGLWVGDAYWACENEATDPLKDFAIHDAVIARAEEAGLQAVIHSHPGGPAWPSAADMRSQAAMDVPYVILPCDLDEPTGQIDVHEPVAFGDCLGIAPVLHRTFVHGWHDCYAVIRDVHRLGAEGLAAQGQGIGWPFPAVPVPDFARDADWWKDPEVDLYRDGFRAAGFREIATSDVRPGDVFLAATPNIGGHNPHDRINHGGLLLPGNLFLHHLPTRLSRREAAGNWLPAVRMWVRHESHDA